MKFEFKKKYGQNFLTDKNLLASIVALSGVKSEDVVLEIGPGAGALTKAIASAAHKVVSFEIDRELEPILKENLAEQSNSLIVFKDFMKVSDEEIETLVGKDYLVIANLPYYITSPILFRFFELEHKPKSLTIMVQKEYGERLVADAGESEYSSLSVLAKMLGTAKIVKNVPRHMFTPVPKVDSCIVHFEFNNKLYDKDMALFIRNCFKMRRKTLVNNLSSSYDLSKNRIQEILKNNQINITARAEDLSLSQFTDIYNSIKNL